MHRKEASFDITTENIGTLKTRILNWTRQFNILVYLDSNGYSSGYDRYELLVGTGLYKTISESSVLTPGTPSPDTKGNWILGHICYDYKNVIEPQLYSKHNIVMGFPVTRFFIPETVCTINKMCTSLTINSINSPEDIWNAILATSAHIDVSSIPQVSFTGDTDESTYKQHIDSLREHIRNGDCYEINYCTSGSAQLPSLPDATAVFHKLNTLSPAPFAAFYRWDDQYMWCASPERYIQRDGDTIISQPIKGTARRDTDKAADDAIRTQLANDIKERAENIMIVDLVRNDLARCCTPGSIQVNELFGVYTFPQVHQLISTVSGTLKHGHEFADIIHASFPMGSMTGAPKYKVMELIEHYEHFRRELFSGTVGYISPDGNFDFNVVIRSLYYNASSGILSYATGGAITWDSTPDGEWQEMHLKAWALKRIFT